MDKQMWIITRIIEQIWTIKADTEEEAIEDAYGDPHSIRVIREPLAWTANEEEGNMKSKSPDTHPRLTDTREARLTLAVAKAQVQQVAKELVGANDIDAFHLLWQLGFVWLQKLEEHRVP